DSAKIVRGIQAYHVKGHGWCDIGYNFLVDKYGQIFEGRRGGIDRSVRAAHSGNGEVNTFAMGVSLMGDFDKIQPGEAMKASVVKLVGWRMGTTYLKAKGTWHVSEKNLTLNLIAGHRNVVGTACPGKYAYAWLSSTGGLRDRVEAYVSKYTSAIKTRAAALGTSVTGPVYIGESAVTGGRRTRFGKVYMYAKTGSAAKYVSHASGFYAKYAALGAQSSSLGFPKGDSPTSTANGTHVQRFEYGSIYAVRSTSQTSNYALWGVLATTYVSLKESTGVLGAPKSSVIIESGGRRANFTKGYIRYTTATKKTVAYDLSGKVISSSTTPSMNTLTIPSSGTFTLRGHGYGHGIGMSQYGAQGAAKSGVKYDKILSTYYPGTVLGTKTGNVRVLISKDTTTSVVVAGRATLTFRKVSDGKAVKLPPVMGGVTVAEWRIIPVSGDGARSALQYKTSGTWKGYAKTSWTGDAQFEAWALKLILPNGSGVYYRGILRSALPNPGSSDRNTVNVLPIEYYVRGVIAAEMPSSWMPEALKAQAVAARTYGVRGLTTSRYYDMCDTTSCQVYRGYSAETDATDAAVAATNAKILTYDGKPAFTQFSSSSGGYTAVGSQPYLKAVADPYDDWSGNANHDWSKTVSASMIQKAYPTIGTLKQLTVTKRNGFGEWGGRVTTVNLVGSKKTVTISGDSARWSFGLKSNWFRFN
ncbi:MAG: SpoIID/LytB domain-containing protein, partial [Aeromicrobium sp.]